MHAPKWEKEKVTAITDLQVLRKHCYKREEENGEAGKGRNTVPMEWSCAESFLMMTQRLVQNWNVYNSNELNNSCKPIALCVRSSARTTCVSYSLASRGHMHVCTRVSVWFECNGGTPSIYHNFWWLSVSWKSKRASHYKFANSIVSSWPGSTREK